MLMAGGVAAGGGAIELNRFYFVNRHIMYLLPALTVMIGVSAFHHARCAVLR